MDPEAPILQTERLVLTPIRETDIDALQDLMSLEPVRRYLLDGDIPEREWVGTVVEESTADFARKGLGLWAVRRRESPDLVGLVGYREYHDPPEEEILWLLHPDAWGAGLAYEMAAAALDRAFEVVGRERMRASTDAPNEASIVLMERLGFVEVRRDAVAPPYKWEQIHCDLDRAVWRRGRRSGARA